MLSVVSKLSFSIKEGMEVDAMKWRFVCFCVVCFCVVGEKESMTYVVCCFIKTMFGSIVKNEKKHFFLPWTVNGRVALFMWLRILLITCL